MQKKAPPIQWLPVFEAAARLCSFRKAADELCVTPPAVSQQIKALEDYLGICLFDRSERQLKLTNAGKHYFASARQIINNHTKSYYELERRFKNPLLHISVPLYIAQEVLIPNFLSFKEMAPDLELRLTTGSDLVDFDKESVDAAVRFGSGQWPGLDCRQLLTVEPVLVCSPKYLEKNGLNADQYFDAALLQQQVLISLHEDARDWIQAQPDVNPDNKIVCDSYFSAIRYAEEGTGIVIGLKPVINKFFEENRLVALKSDPWEATLAYWLVAPESMDRRPDIERFYQWVKGLFGDFLL